MAGSRYDIITTKAVAHLSALLERLRVWLMQSRARDLVLMALP